MQENQNIEYKGIWKDVGKELNNIQNQIVSIILKNNKITIQKLAKTINTTSRTIERNIKILKQFKILERTGGRKEGFWKIK